MKNRFWLALVIFSSASLAHGVPESIEITPESAEKLGFKVLVEYEGPVIVVKLNGPKTSPRGCPASRSGTYLLDKRGEELLVHITEIGSSNSGPEVIGYYTNMSHSMGVFIDYWCPKGNASKSRRYEVTSIRKWLITNH